MGKGNKVEFFVAICALLTSMVAVFIAWDQARVMRLQQRAEVWPLLQISQNTDYRGDTINYALVVENAGIGPALIESFTLRSADDGAVVSLADFGREIAPASFRPPPPHTYSEIKGRVLSQGRSIRFITASWPGTPERRADFQARLDEIISGERGLPVIEICFCSILDECWIARSDATNAKPVPARACPQTE